VGPRLRAARAGRERRADSGVTQRFRAFRVDPPRSVTLKRAPIGLSPPQLQPRAMSPGFFATSGKALLAGCGKQKGRLRRAAFCATATKRGLGGQLPFSAAPAEQTQCIETGSHERQRAGNWSAADGRIRRSVKGRKFAFDKKRFAITVVIRTKVSLIDKINTQLRAIGKSEVNRVTPGNLHTRISPAIDPRRRQDQSAVCGRSGWRWHRENKSSGYRKVATRVTE